MKQKRFSSNENQKDKSLKHKSKNDEKLKNSKIRKTESVNNPLTEETGSIVLSNLGLLADSKLLEVKKNIITKPVVWIDCEMTGLNVFNDHIIEICCIITDNKFHIIDDIGYESTIYYPKKVLDSMSEWCITQHTKSGLIKNVLQNTERTLSVVESELYDYITKVIPDPNTGIMAGNSIHMDKFFMIREFPKIINYLNYRLLDVSSIMEFGYRHNPELMKCYPKTKTNHTARSDILASIKQLKWYKEHYFKNFDDSIDFINECKNKLNINSNASTDSG